MGNAGALMIVTRMGFGVSGTTLSALGVRNCREQGLSEPM